jgi:hypothetical protein
MWGQFVLIDVILCIIIFTLSTSVLYASLNTFKNLSEIEEDKYLLERAGNTLNTFLTTTLNSSASGINVSGFKPVSELIAEALYFKS